MFKRFLALALALVMCLGVFAGCGNNGQDETTSKQGKPDQGGDVVTGDLLFEEPFYIECVTYSVTDANRTNSEATKAIRTATNVYLSYRELDDFDQQYALMLTDQDVPDLSFFWSNEIAPVYGPRGAFIDLYQYLDKMPNVKEFMEKYPVAFNEYLTFDEDGEKHMYALPAVSNGTTAPYQYLYRADIFEKHNLTWPDSQEGFYNLLKELKKLYPNSYPFCMRSLDADGLMYWARHWGTQMTQPTSSFTYVSINRETGEWYHAESSTAMRECVTFVNQLINEGLMLRTSLTLDTDGWQTAFAGEKSFITYDKLDRLEIMNSILQDVDPSYRLTGGQAFACGTNGTALVGGSVGAVGRTNYNFAVGREADVEKMCKFLNWMYSDEGIEVTNWGLRGKNHTVNADGKKEFTEDMYEIAEEANTGIKFATCFGYSGLTAVTDYESWMATCAPDIKAAYERAEAQYGLKGQQVLSKYTEAEQAVIDQYGLGLKSFAGQTLAEFMSGERAIDDTQWNWFVNECEKRGVSKLIAAHKPAFEREWGHLLEQIEGQ